MAKYVINPNQIEYVYKGSTDYFIYFIGGRFLTLPSYEVPTTLYKFTDTVFINPNQIKYAKNNFQETKQKYKVVIVLSKEFYVTYEKIKDAQKKWKEVKEIVKNIEA